MHYDPARDDLYLALARAHRELSERIGLGKRRRALALPGKLRRAATAARCCASLAWAYGLGLAAEAFCPSKAPQAKARILQTAGACSEQMRLCLQSLAPAGESEIAYRDALGLALAQEAASIVEACAKRRALREMPSGMAAAANDALRDNLLALYGPAQNLPGAEKICALIESRPGLCSFRPAAGLPELAELAEMAARSSPGTASQKSHVLSRLSALREAQTLSDCCLAPAPAAPEAPRRPERARAL